MTQKLICFLCTGNYYRSRYAEEYFNHHAKRVNLDWQAESRALHQNLGSVQNPGSMSPIAIGALWLKGIRPRQTKRPAKTLEQEQLSQFTQFIALDKDEHTPYVEIYYPMLKEHVSYWDIKDMDKESPFNALTKIDRYVKQLIESLVLISESRVD